MANKLVIAAAGSGKTTYLVKQALGINDSKVLITTFTEANEREIRKKFIEIGGCIPPNIVIETWFSFLIHQGVKPYQSYLYDGKVTGLKLVNEKSAFRYFYGRIPVYHKEEDVQNHYFTSSGRIYSDKLSKFVHRVNELSNGLVLERLARCYKHIFIDEVQDLAGYDLELINLLSQQNIELLMVGDPRQTTFHTHEEVKNKAKYGDGEIEKYVRDRCPSVAIDNTTLNVTHRNELRICNFGNSIFPEYSPCSADAKEHTGHDGVFFLHPTDVDAYLAKYRPMQLRDKITVAVNNEYPAMNFGDSKGLTFKRVLIYPTKPMEDWIFDHAKEMKYKSRSRFYVAVTRAMYSVAIVTKKAGDGIEGVCVWNDIP